MHFNSLCGTITTVLRQKDSTAYK